MTTSPTTAPVQRRSPGDVRVPATPSRTAQPGPDDAHRCPRCGGHMVIDLVFAHAGRCPRCESTLVLGQWG